MLEKNSSLGLYMVPEQEYDKIRQWSNGICTGLWVGWGGCNSLTDFFLHFFVTCDDEKIGFLCTNKACQEKMNAHNLAISNSLCARWVS